MFFDLSDREITILGCLSILLTCVGGLGLCGVVIGHGVQVAGLDTSGVVSEKAGAVGAFMGLALALAIGACAFMEGRKSERRDASDAA
ncbi:MULTISPECIES: hypothetical protein [Caballeronia]|uniref:hypothetical protein n=1 Tax=Caballeronia TaxID=1827195 RepID=UPI001FD36A97|nr:MULTISPECIES: hypothetical protein [Caballeronia]MDR5799025.1 hypothetical protein [Caballeronia sp. LZ001]